MPGPDDRFMAPREDTPEVDLQALEAKLRSAGIASLRDRLLATFRKDAPARMAAIETALRAGDAGALSRGAHAYKGSASAIDALALAAELRHLEALPPEQLAGASRFVARIRARHDRALAQLAPVSAQGV